MNSNVRKVDARLVDNGERVNYSESNVTEQDISEISRSIGQSVNIAVYYALLRGERVEVTVSHKSRKKEV